MANEFVARKGLIVSGSILGNASTQFGSASGHTHRFTGSLAITDGINVQSSTAVPNYFGDSITDLHIFTGSLRITGSTAVTGSLSVTDGLNIQSSTAVPNFFGDSITDLHLFTGSVNISGSSTITGPLTVTQGVTGSFSGTASYAVNSDLLDGLNSTVFATTGSNIFSGSQFVSGSVTIRATTNNQNPILQINEFRGGSLAKIYESGDAGLLEVGYFGLTGTRTVIDGGISDNLTSITMFQGTTSSIVLRSNGISYFNGGNIGIGTTNPTNTLQVQGNVSASSYTSSINNAVGFFGTASYAVNADTLDGLNSTVFATTGSNTFTGVQTISNTTNSTLFNNGALIVQGGVGIAKDVNISGSWNITGILTVATMSTQYVTSSQYNIGVSRVVVNDDDLVRFAGISVVDSGSTYGTGSLLWDSFYNRWIYQADDQNYNSAIIIAGPKNSGNLGDEVGLVVGRVPVASGDDHIDNRIESSSIRVDFPSRLTHIEAGLYVTGGISASSGFTGSLFGTSSNAITASYAPVGPGTVNSIALFNSSTTVSSSNIFQLGNDIGIGTSTPSSTLHISSNTTTVTLEDNNSAQPTSIAYILYKYNAGNLGFVGYDGVSTGSLKLWNEYSSGPTGGNILFGTNNTERMRIDVSGHVGIGTIPSASLQVQGNVSASSYTSSISNAVGFFGTASWAQNATTASGLSGGTANYIPLWTSATVQSSSVIFQSASNIGINDSSPTDPLVVNGRMRINATNKLSFGTATGGYADISITGSTQGTMLFRTWDGSAFVERMRIESASGNIGIGTTSPTNKLQIVGNVSASSYTSSISNAVGYFGTASWAQNATSASAATSITFTPATASLALAVSGSANRVLYNNAVNTTTTSANLVFDGTNLTIGGQLNAATKSFLINHRTKPGKKLVYGVVEGPEHSVFIRGKLDNTNIITLPEEWEWLVDVNSITVQLTSIGKHQKLYVKEINKRYITVENGNWFSGKVHCHYLVHAVRKDVPPLQTVV